MNTMNGVSTEDRTRVAARDANRIPRFTAWVFVAALIAGGGMLAFAIHGGITTRVEAESTLAHTTEEAAIPIVNVIHPTEGAPLEELILPGNTQAFNDTPIFARTNGYLKRWLFDIGAHVKRGDLLAEIETPEIDKQLQQARADRETAQANYHLAETTAARWQFLLQSDSVSRQETDEKVADLSARKATVDSNASNVHRLEDLQSFQKVYAPFDGIITARNTDVGALIDAGANSAGKELFHLAAIDTLRVFVTIPEVYSRAARLGAVASLTLDEYPGRSFHGTLARTSNSIDQASHTLLTEVDVPNSAGQLLPGSYVFVHFKLPQTIRSVVIPSNTLLFRSEGLRVALVRDGHVQLTPIKIGRDYGSTVEVISGLQASDSVVLDPADSLVNGAPVRSGSRAAKGRGGAGKMTRSGVGIAAVLACLLAGCAVGPRYKVPDVPLTPAYKEADGWKAAHPGDQVLRGPWWEIFGDAQLNALEEQVQGGNQNLKGLEARFREARAVIRFNRASEFPTISTAPSIASIRDSANHPYLPAGAARATGDFVLPFDVSYELDFWGRVRRTRRFRG